MLSRRLGEVAGQFRDWLSRVPANLRAPQNPEETTTGIDRSPMRVQAICAKRGIDMAAFKSVPMYHLPSSQGGGAHCCESLPLSLATGATFVR